MRICVDSCAINRITIKRMHTIATLEDMLRKLHRGKYFSKITF